MSAGAVSGSNEAGTSQSQDTGRLRILQVSGSAAGGVRAHLADCARILASDGHDVIVEAPVSVLDGLDVAPARAEALEIGPRPSIGDTLAVARLRRLGAEPTPSTPTACAPVLWPPSPWGDAGVVAPGWLSPSTTSLSEVA